MSDIVNISLDNIKTQPIPTIDYMINDIDEYIVVVNLPEDWDTVHNILLMKMK